ncbi:MAG: helix-turn-helix domain-containing protein [Xanthobacteraceae bacterium]
MDALLSQKQTAQILGLSVRTLERYRLAGTGPRYARLGRLIRYRKCDLAEFRMIVTRAAISLPISSSSDFAVARLAPASALARPADDTAGWKVDVPT